MVILNVHFYKVFSMIDILSISSEIAFMWIPLNFTDERSTLAQVMHDI